jgi:hypothetical protein
MELVPERPDVINYIGHLHRASQRLIYNREGDEAFCLVLGVAIPDKPAGHVRFQTVTDCPYRDIIKKAQNDFLTFSPRQEFQSNGDKALAKDNGRIHGLWIQLQRSFVWGEETSINLSRLRNTNEEKNDKNFASDDFLHI